MIRIEANFSVAMEGGYCKSVTNKKRISGNTKILLTICQPGGKKTLKDAKRVARVRVVVKCGADFHGKISSLTGINIILFQRRGM